MKGYLVLWMNHAIGTWGTVCAVFYLMVRSKNTQCQSALTFVRCGDARRCSSSTLSTRQCANKASGKLTITDSIHRGGLRLFGSQLTLSGTGSQPSTRTFVVQHTLCRVASATRRSVPTTAPRCALRKRGQASGRPSQRMMTAVRAAHAVPAPPKLYRRKTPVPDALTSHARR
jgi:hypothetical protein